MKRLICILLTLILALHSFAAFATEADPAGAAAQDAGAEAQGGEGEQHDYEHAVIGNPTKLNGCFFTNLWGTITSDADVRDLVAGYNLVKWDGGFSVYRFDRSVVSGAVSGMDRDGNKRYIVTLCDDLYVSDGTPVTAWDYAFSVLFQCSPLISGLGGRTAKLDYLLGYEEYSSGAVRELAGVRVENDRQITFIVRGEALPYVFELARFRFCPYPAGTIAPGCRVYDSENGVYIGNEADPDGEPLLTADLLRKTILDPETGYLVHPDPCTGPYRIESYDGTTAEFSLNAWYKGNEEGEKPRIKHVTYTHARYDTMMDGLASGEYTILNKVMPARTVRSGVELCLSDDQFARAGYLRTGLSYFYFMPGSAAVQNGNVRRAAAYCLDKTQFMHGYVGIFGVEADGLYGMGQWMYLLATGAMDYPVAKPADMTNGEAVSAYEAELADWKTINLNGLARYDCSPEQAGALLEAEGWNLNGQGEAYRAGTDAVRYRKAEDGSLQPLTLSIAYADMDGMEQPMNDYFGANLAAAGFDVRIVPAPAAELEQMMYDSGTPAYDLVFLGQNFSAAFDPKGIFTEGAAMFSGETAPDSLPAVHAELLELAEEMERTEKDDIFGYMKKWVTFQERLSEDLPVIPVFINVYFDFYSRNLHDYRIADKSSCAEAVVPARMYAADLPADEEKQQLADVYSLILRDEPVEDLAVFETGHQEPEIPDPAAGALASFPKEIRDQIPGEYRAVNEFVTVSVGEYENIKSLTVRFSFEAKYPAGETVYLLFGVKEDNRVNWFVQEAEVLGNGTVSVPLEKEQLDLLAGKQFPLVVVSKQ